ncbi:flotillin family protein [Candidatus Sumerlaeota bacterium]|nr:flotillin family protein [Candidatus Sumerlaeota bacterium]
MLSELVSGLIAGAAGVPAEEAAYWVLWVVGGTLVTIFLFIFVYAQRYRKVGPNEALIISGKGSMFRTVDGRIDRRGFRILRGGGTFVWPVFERVDVISLELMTIEVRTPEVYTVLGVPVVVDGVAQIKVRGDDSAISTAAEQFLGKAETEIHHVAQQTLEGHLRAILGTLTVEEIYKNRDAFAQQVQKVALEDMANMGLQVVSFTIRDIRDKEGYLDALGKPRTAQVKRDAVIGQAEADRDAAIKSAVAKQAAREAEFAAETRIKEAERDFKIQVADFDKAANLKRAEADLAYELQKNTTLQKVKAEEIQVQVVEKQKGIDVQEMEIKRREKELDAQIKKPAEAERYKIETLAVAQQNKYQVEAQGEAEAKRSIGYAEADIIQRTGECEATANKARGLATADVIRAQGFAEAEAMRKKAESWQLYNQAAVAQMFVEALPAIARAIAEPLSKTERMVIINMGGDGGGASRVTRDVTQIVAQLPAVIESLTGVKLDTLLEKIPGLREQTAQQQSSAPAESKTS